MHSLYSVKKKVQAEAHAQNISLHLDIPKIRSDQFVERTAIMADKYREKERAMKDSDIESPRLAMSPQAIAKDRQLWAVDEPLHHNASLHCFRDRVKTAELFHGCISPCKYVPEKDRIAKNIQSESFEGIRWSTVW